MFFFSENWRVEKWIHSTTQWMGSLTPLPLNKKNRKVTLIYFEFKLNKSTIPDKSVIPDQN